MQISGHYAGFPEKTLVVILNHERARIFRAHGHDFTEEPELHAEGETIGNTHALNAFFALVVTHMEHILQKNTAKEFLICVPEIYRVQFHQVIPTALHKHIKRTVPKNLTAMEEGPIIRILFEG